MCHTGTAPGVIAVGAPITSVGIIIQAFVACAEINPHELRPVDQLHADLSKGGLRYLLEVSASQDQPAVFQRIADVGYKGQRPRVDINVRGMLNTIVSEG